MKIGTNINGKTKDLAVFEGSSFVTTEQGARAVLRLLYQSLHQSFLPPSLVNTTQGSTFGSD